MKFSNLDVKDVIYEGDAKKVIQTIKGSVQD